MSKITTIIFSKNRACQLELLLRSLNMPATILFTHDIEFQEGYEKLMMMYPKFHFVKERNFKKQVIKLIGNSKYVMFLCDDDIMIEHFKEDCSEFVEFKKNKDIVCLSLRISPNYNRAPALKNNTWKWKGEKKDWGYPMSVTSSIFRKKDILPAIIKEKFKTPNGLEVKLRRNVPNRKLMMCFDSPKTINNLANRVQSKYPNRNNLGIPLSDLNERFLRGGRLSLSYIKEKAKKSKSCFLMVHYKWEGNWLSLYRKNVFSQRGEDGVLQKIFKVLGVDKGWCVDVGAYGKINSNTYNLMRKGWSGVFIENDKERVRQLKEMYPQKNARCLYGTVRPTGVKRLDNLLKKSSMPKNFELISIDIDGNDYYIWKFLKEYIPQVVVIEFNSTFDFDDYLQPIDGEGGASLSKIVELGKAKGYELITTTDFNAFFVKKELFDKFGIADNSTDKLFTKNKSLYGKTFRNN